MATAENVGRDSLHAGPDQPEGPRAARRARPAATSLPWPEVPFEAAPFRARVRAEAAPHWRELPWRQTHDPYLIWISEVMLQQTQVARVAQRWEDWLERFPTVQALAQSAPADVLDAWQGMGYNRRALALHRAARAVVEEFGGTFPHDEAALLALPGVGPSTAAGIRAFAFDEAGVYLETNVRAVFLHELFPTAESVPDKALVPLVRAACPPSGQDVRGWYYALLDLGAHLKKSVPNPSRRSASHTRQSRFEGSFRQKRAEVVRILLAARGEGVALTCAQVGELLAREEEACGRPAPEPDLAAEVLAALAREGMCVETPRGWCIAG